MSFVPVNPKPLLEDWAKESKEILVRLKWSETEYKGTLVSADNYMNILLNNAQECAPDRPPVDLGQVLIRCNNVLWIRRPDEAQKGNDIMMHD